MPKKESNFNQLMEDFIHYGIVVNFDSELMEKETKRLFPLMCLSDRDRETFLKAILQVAENERVNRAKKRK